MCISPIKMYRLAEVNPDTGKNVCIPADSWRAYSKNSSSWEKIIREEFEVSCGRCHECRLKRSKEWAQRCVLEARDWEHNYFITLTYDDEHLTWSNADEYELGPGEFLLRQPAMTLVKDDFQKFMKRLRQNLFRDYGLPSPRYYACGEYGEVYQRPHFHFIGFNLEIPDLKFFKTSWNGDIYYTSDFLKNTWGKGFVLVADVTLESCQYVARYVHKKRVGRRAEEYIFENRSPEFSLMSRRPGIARNYFDEEHERFYNYDEINELGINKAKPCKYFDRLFEDLHPDVMKLIKDERKRKAKEIEKQINLRCQYEPEERSAIKARKFKNILKKLKRPLD